MIRSAQSSIIRIKCVKIRSARDTNDIFCPLYIECQPSRCRFACGKLIFPHWCGKILSARKIKINLTFYRTSAGQSTFLTQNDTDSGNFRCTAEKIVYFESSAERRILTYDRVATCLRVKIRSARDTNDIFCPLYIESQPSRCRFACGKLIFHTLKILPHWCGNINVGSNFFYAININFTRVVVNFALLGHQTSHSQNTFFFPNCTIYYSEKNSMFPYTILPSQDRRQLCNPS